jgi:hypothetical protein
MDFSDVMEDVLAAMVNSGELYSVVGRSSHQGVLGAQPRGRED